MARRMRVVLRAARCLRELARARVPNPPAEADRGADRVLREEGPAGPGRALLLVPRAKKQNAGLRLDTAAGLKAGADDGPVVVPGDPAKSRLVKAVKREGDFPMPPKDRRSRPKRSRC